MNDEKDDLVVRETTEKNHDARVEAIRERDNLDAKYGYEKFMEPKRRTAWLVNFQPSEVVDSTTKKVVAAVDFYFLESNGRRFKLAFPYRPYLYLGVVPQSEYYVAAHLSRKYESLVIEHVEKEDLDLKNHLSGLKSKFLKVYFPSTLEMASFKRDQLKQIKKNQEHHKTVTDYTTMLAQNMGCDTGNQFGEPHEQITDIREYDLPYHMRVCIDNKIFAGLWYDVVGLDERTRKPTITRNVDIVEPFDPVVCAYDIETTKLPLKFPDSEFDQIMMISYMIDGRGYLIINRQIVNADIEDFEYTPRPEFRGEFMVFNEPDEKATISKFFDHLLKAKPSIMVSYNGDFFDWPFVETRAKFHQLDMSKMIGFSKDAQDEYKSTCCVHMDAFRWVKRDSYLPMGSQNLKATTKAKLRYDPVELDPELMCEMARNQPQVLANYSVSDAVATYYLYMKYVHPFIFALCTIIPLGPDDVLRKGSGTLCEALLMVEAYHKNIIYPNKQITRDHYFTSDGHLVQSETYVGARVEALESGVFRSDIPVKFRLDVERLEVLKSDVQEAMKHTLTTEMNVPFEELVDFEEVCQKVQEKIDELITKPIREEPPKIYHLDVSAMYPNIILTNRLQPPAVVTDEDCLACVHNTPDAQCKRELEWKWRAEIVPATRGEYERIKNGLEEQRFGKPPKPFHQLPKEEQQKLEKQRLNDFCRRAYGKQHITREEKRQTRICQRENPFYVDTVLAFRDRRYEYKAMLKVRTIEDRSKAKGSLASVDPSDLVGMKTGQARVVLYESLQLAHKCILNSFYGYVMRRGSRWFSIEMAGIVCNTGSMIISEACELIERVGRPLELDTDGIWCLLPSSFPEDFQFKTTSGKAVSISYPGAVLNALVKDRFTNTQYHQVNSDGTFEIRNENSIFFEVDGPYLAMILPASKEAGKKLKKRYAVFNPDGSLAELKGFEVKRRGELGIIKQFQTEVFKDFLKGSNLKEIYENVAKEANYWLDILSSRGKCITDEELFELIAENRSMSKKLEEYGDQKSTSITTAKRLADLLGPEMVRNAGLACQFIISREPLDAPVTERTIPLAIFQSERRLMVKFLRKWTKSSKIDENIDVRDLIDWDYYAERLHSCIQKIITIPAALQGIENPVPRVKHPDWLEAEKRRKLDLHLQPRINEIFKKITTPKTTPRSNRKRPFDEDSQNRQGTSDVANLQPTTPKRIRTQQPLPLERKTFAKNGFKEWLKYLVQRWERQREKYRESKKLNAGNVVVKRGMTAMQQAMVISTERVRSHDWHIMQICETSSLGVYDVYAVADGLLRRFELIVPRTFYVDDTFERTNSKIGCRVEKHLPRMRPHAFLYEYNVDEKRFVEKLSGFHQELCRMRLNGIYETQMPLIFRAILKLGATSRVKSLTNSTRIATDQMERIASRDIHYVPLSSFHILYFYEFTLRGRTAFGLFCPHLSQAHVFVVNRAKVDAPNLNGTLRSAYAKFCQKRGEEETYKNVENITVKFGQATFLKDAVRQLQQTVKSWKLSDSMDPVIVCIQSQKSTTTLRKEFPLLTSFPSVRINANDSPSFMTGLEWVTNICKIMAQHFLNSLTVVKDYWLVSEYIGVPVGNLPDDIALLALDVVYARALQQQNYILWATPSGRPDFGGKELDDWRLGSDWENVSFRSTLSHVYDNEIFEARNICVEFDLGVLAISSLMQSAIIAEAEGTSEYIGFTAEQTHMTIDAAAHSLRRAALSEYNEAFSVSAALRVLRSVCTEMVRDIRPNESTFADQMIINLYRWLRSPAALLYDPAVEQAVFTLMRKLCLLLVSELNRLGATVIHCSFSKVVISTNRSDLQAAKAFVRTLRSSLQQKKPFNSLNLIPVVYSRLMVWINASNKAYVKCYDAQNDQEMDDNNKVRVEMRLADVLPEAGDCRRAFVNNVLAYYLVLLCKKNREQLSDEEFASFCADSFRNVMAPKIFDMTNKLNEAQPQLRTLMESEDNPILKSYGLPKFYNVSLEFLKCIFKVFGLCSYASEVIDEIRTQALLMIGKDEISDDTFWKPPRVSVVLEQVLCPHCYLNVDFDVCAQKHAETESGESSFLCPYCTKPLPSTTVEEELIDRITKMQIAYLLQDFKCARCKQVATLYLTTTCERCCAELQNTISIDEFLINLEVLLEIAKTYQLENLSFVVNQIREQTNMTIESQT
ncbi:DNA polymerase epsilon catalytic subunit A [Aphelenchoides besseyi]|nr:DNA polymerase epsilon catalytic subunit A [Aphelenchoides besseyi]KAI6221725.1 DNA polymerase epsilon catalytic subunit A [Aphelenchoides besseyi]